MRLLHSYWCGCWAPSRLSLALKEAISEVASWRVVVLSGLRAKVLTGVP